MGAPVGRAALESLKAEAARLREENERLGRQGKQLEKEIQQLKAQGAQAQARSICAKEVASFRVYSERFPEPMDPAALRSSADAIRKRDPEAIIFLCDPGGLCVAASGDAAQKRGIRANELLQLSTQVAGGSGGGRPDMAQGRVNEPSRFSEIRSRLEGYILEHSKG
ncbi:MAG: hypothetical protein HYZ95_00980 [Candidatus Omnitrophica bacterium]|nr:hypothetical protein [Candidatus Omnitrophota bacterium]